MGWVKTLKMFTCMISIVESEVIYSLLNFSCQLEMLSTWVIVTYGFVID